VAETLPQYSKYIGRMLDRFGGPPQVMPQEQQMMPMGPQMPPPMMPQMPPPMMPQEQQTMPPPQVMPPPLVATGMGRRMGGEFVDDQQELDLPPMGSPVQEFRGGGIASLRRY